MNLDQLAWVNWVHFTRPYQFTYVRNKRTKNLIFLLTRYLASPRPTVGHYQGGSLTNPMLITSYLQFDPKVTGSLVTRLDP